MTLEKKVKPEDLSKDDSFLQGTIYDLYRENYSYSQEDIAFSDAQFLMDSRTIRDIAKKGQCVILGKCADYVLGDDIVLSVFIYASEDFKLNRIEKDYNIKKDKIEAKMNREDMKRKITMRETQEDYGVNHRFMTYLLTLLHFPLILLRI